MTTVKEKIKKNYVTFNMMIFFILLLFFLLFQIWKTHQKKLQDYTRADLTTVKGTLEKKPKYTHSRYNRSLNIYLNEFPKTSFSNSGIYLIPLDIEKIINNSKAGDTAEISILTEDLKSFGLNGQKFTIQELKINRKEYLSLESLNAMLREERPNQFGAGLNIIIILSVVILAQALMVFGKQ